MSDSTPYFDAEGIRRDRPMLPPRHQIDDASLLFLGLLADLGRPGTMQRRGWENLLLVHGFKAVVMATARCFHLVDGSERVSNEQAQAVLDGKLPGGHAIQRHTTYQRRSQVA